MRRKYKQEENVKNMRAKIRRHLIREHELNAKELHVVLPQQKQKPTLWAHTHMPIARMTCLPSDHTCIRAEAKIALANSTSHLSKDSKEKPSSVHNNTIVLCT